MVREILFKAKRVDNGEWVEGYYVFCRKRHYILPIVNKIIGYDEREYGWIEIDPETLCQYTGLTDKKGKKIWEDDIVAFIDTASTEIDCSEANCCGIVSWDIKTASFRVANMMMEGSYEVL